jgi:hypothetical protein
MLDRYGAIAKGNAAEGRRLGVENIACYWLTTHARL